MFYSNGYNIQMTEGDFGIELPITMTGPTFAAEDSVKLTIKDAINGNTLLEKDFSNIQNSTINFELTREESEQLPVGIAPLQRTAIHSKAIRYSCTS